MKKENGNDMPFKADEVNWDELSGIGIMNHPAAGPQGRGTAAGNPGSDTAGQIA